MERELGGQASERNYKRFAAMAGVRGAGPTPRGLPEDISESVAMFFDDWDADGHSHSWLGITEAVPIYLDTQFYLGTQGSEKDRCLTHEAVYQTIFDLWDGTDDPIVMAAKYRIVFWFDN